MPTLLDQPSEEALRFIRVVGLGFDEASGTWPCWQWVKQQLWLQGLDAEEILEGLPTWQHNYRSVRVGSHGQLPQNGDPVPLTVHGLANTVVPAIRPLLRGFLTAVQIAIVMQQGIKPSPTEPVELKVPGEDFTRTVNQQAGTQLTVAQLFGSSRASRPPGGESTRTQARRTGT
jgi:hypothetical protein